MANMEDRRRCVDHIPGGVVIGGLQMEIHEPAAFLERLAPEYQTALLRTLEMLQRLGPIGLLIYDKSGKFSILASGPVNMEALPFVPEDQAVAGPTAAELADIEVVLPN